MSLFSIYAIILTVGYILYYLAMITIELTSKSKKETTEEEIIQSEFDSPPVRVVQSEEGYTTERFYGSASVDDPNVPDEPDNLSLETPTPVASPIFGSEQPTYPTGGTIIVGGTISEDTLPPYEPETPGKKDEESDEYEGFQKIDFDNPPPPNPSVQQQPPVYDESRLMNPDNVLVDESYSVTSKYDAQKTETDSHIELVNASLETIPPTSRLSHGELRSSAFRQALMTNPDIVTKNERRTL